MKLNLRILLFLFLGATMSNSLNAQMNYVNRIWDMSNGGLINNHNDISCALDPDGNLVYIGNNSNGSNSDIFLNCIHPNGNVEWEETCSSCPTEDDWGTDIKIDTSGNIYVSGVHNNGSNQDYFVAKYSQSGILLWEQFHNGNANGDDQAIAIEIDDLGNVYVTGTSTRVGLMTDITTVKYDTGGSLQWTKHYDYNSKAEVASDIQIDSNGDILVLGTSASSFLDASFVVEKYDAAGNTLGTKRHNSVGQGYDYPHEMVVDSGNNVYIVGTSDNNGNLNIKTLGLSNTLTVLWEYYIDESGSNDEGFGIVADDYNGVYITGNTTKNNGGKDFVTVKLDATTGVEIWRDNKIPMDPTQTAKGYDLKITEQGNICVVGVVDSMGVSNFETRIFTSGGSLLSEMNFLGDLNNAASAEQVIVDGEDVYVTGRTSDGITNNISSVKYSLVERSTVSAVDSVSGNKYVDDAIIIRFDKKSIIYNAIDKREFTTGILSDFVKPHVLTEMESKTGINWDKKRTFKIFRGMTTADSTSLTRLGNIIKIDELWATLVVYVDPIDDEDLLIDSLNAITPHIHYAEKDWMIEKYSIPNDTYISNQQESLIPTTTYPNAHINVDQAWDIEVGQSYVKVGVIDDPIFWQHTEFGDGTFAGSKVIDGWDVVNDVHISNVTDPESHGTACAGIIGAQRNNGYGIAGIAGGDVDGASNTGVELVSLGVFDGSSSPASVIAEGIASAGIESPSSNYGFGVHLENVSLGGFEYSSLMEDAVEVVWRNHCVFVAARGHDALDAVTYPSCFDDNQVISVSASGTDGAFKHLGNGDNYISNFGQNHDLVAPGTSQIVSSTVNPNFPYGFGGCPVGTSFDCFSGTSAAAPHVTGASALMYSYHNTNNGSPNNLSTEDVEYFLQNSAIDKGANGYDQYNAWGLLNTYGAISQIEMPYYYVKHSDFILPTITNQGLHFVTFLSTTFTSGSGISPGTYNAVKYNLGWTYVEVLPTNHAIKDWWILEAGTYRGVSGSSTIDGTPYMPLSSNVTIGSNIATVAAFTHTWHILSSSGGTVIDEWFPAPPDELGLMFSLYVEDTDFAGVEELDSNNKFDLYPNPSSNVINLSFELENNSDVLLEIYDSQGKVVVNESLGIMDAGTRNLVLNVSNLSNGMYVCRITTEHEVITETFVRN